MTIEQLYQWAKEHKCEKLPLYKKFGACASEIRIEDVYMWTGSNYAPPKETIVIID